MRIGFEDDRHFETILDLIEKHQIDLLSLHARTVKEAYRSEVHYEYITRAVERLNIPVLANGNVTSVAKGQWVLDETRATGLMIGRHCIRNPWIFRQMREHFAGEAIFQPTLADVRQYIEDLYEATTIPDRKGHFHINHLKKFLNFVGLSVDTDGQFLHDMRRAKIQRRTRCHLRSTSHRQRPGKRAHFPDEPIKGLVARPNCETAQGCSL